jgi:TonB family protein
MKKQLSLLACLVFAATTALAQPPGATPVVQTRQVELSAWPTYTIKDELVSARLPTHPALITSRRYRRVVRQILIDRTAAAYADGVVYAIYTYDNREPRDTFEDFIAAQPERDRLDLSTARSVTIGRYSGREYSTQNRDLPQTVQFFAVEDRLYKFVATGAPADDPAVKQFFSSIALDRKQGIEVSDGPGVPLSDAGTAEILTGKQVDSKVRLIVNAEPSYSEEAREKEIAGTVILKVIFGADGRVGNIRIVQGLPHGLTERAIDAARKIKFIPARKDGKFVSMWLQLEYNFNLY